MISDVFYIWTGKIAYVLLGILAASIAGTLSYLVWLFLEKETAKFHVRISMPFLRMVLACFLIPIVPFVVYAFVKIPELGTMILLIPTTMATILLIVVPICLIGLVVVSINKYWEHRKKAYLCRDNVPITDEKYYAMLDKWCKRLNLRKKIYLSFNEYIRSPGVLQHKGYQIVMPTYIGNDKEFTMALLHELVHLKHGDLLTKNIGAVANVLHSFNPVISSLREDLEKWTEVDCDRETCEVGKEEFSRDEYFECMMDLKERSETESDLKDICGFVENQDLVAFRVNTMLELDRDELKAPLLGYVVTWFFLVLLTVGSFSVSSLVYQFLVEVVANYSEETLDVTLPEISTMELFIDTKLVYSDEDVFNQENGLEFIIEPGETWIFDVSGKNMREVSLDIRCDEGNYLVGGIGEEKQVLCMEGNGHLTDWLSMNHGHIQQIFVQNLEKESIKIELFIFEQ